MTADKVDGRASGLNCKGYPLREITYTTADGDHVLVCGHILPPVSTAYVRWRRCPSCKVDEASRRKVAAEFAESDGERMTAAVAGWPSIPCWFVLRRRDTEPTEVYPFVTRAEAEEFYERASEQWSETYLCRIVRP